ncbi:MAG: hypothetical protein WD876_01495 [Candidatus Pacearchaeota archaeon]
MPHQHIQKILKEHSPEGVHKAKRLLSFKYPKLMLLVAAIVLAYYVFKLPSVKIFVSGLQVNYISDFIAGILFSFGFTTPFSIGYFITTTPANILITSLIAGVGSVIGDMIIFRTIKISFMDEFKKLEKKKAIRKIGEIIKNNPHVLIRHYLVYIFAGIILASPLPDELGVSMLAGLTTIKPKIFMALSFILHVIGFYAIMWIAG